LQSKRILPVKAITPNKISCIKHHFTRNFFRSKMSTGQMDSTTAQENPNTDLSHSPTHRPEDTLKDPERRFVSSTSSTFSTYASSFLVYQTATRIMAEVKCQGSESIRQTIQVAKRYMQQYPALRTFMYSSALLSILPVGIFTICFAVSLMVSMGTALAGVFLVQSGIFFIGMTVLVPVEIGILCLAGGAALLLNGTAAKKYLEYPERVINKYESFLIKEESNDTLVM
jgi:hypothetical protein